MEGNSDPEVIKLNEYMPCMHWAGKPEAPGSVIRHTEVPSTLMYCSNRYETLLRRTGDDREVFEGHERDI